MLAGSPKGRFEHTGQVEATIRAGGKTIRLGGVGKAHEQTQTAPRFTAPFTYAMLWSADSGMIGLLSPERGYGDLDLAGRDTPMDRFRIEPWSPSRRFVAMLKDGRRVEGPSAGNRGELPGADLRATSGAATWSAHRSPAIP